MSTTRELLQQAKQVLQDNDHGHFTAPAKDMYPHQWLWDSCFTAIGLRHLDVDRAQLEVTSLVQGQWHNGMLPHVIFASNGGKLRDWGIWNSWVSPMAPDDVSTSGITQPPMLAEAVVRIGEKLTLGERRTWYKQMYGPLVKYHQWLYEERDPHGEGLVLLVHPWESGLDNSPPWMEELHRHQLPGWIRFLEKTRLEMVMSLLRTDTRFVSREQRLSNLEALALYDIQRRLRRKRYDINAILNRSMFTIEDLAFNCILIRANAHLRDIAKSIRQPLPAPLKERMELAEDALEHMWDPASAQYYSRDFITHHLLKEPTVATLLPLYAGCISRERAAGLVKMLENDKLFGPAFPVPSVPVESDYFDRDRYWQGPTWVNMNWLIIDGLLRYGYRDHAAALRDSTVEMVAKAGLSEYFDPISGEALGAKDFSWTAALTIDLIKR